MSDPFELYAIRLAHADRPARDNFLRGPAREGTMRMDFDMWVARNGERIVAIDSGFSVEGGSHRGRHLERTPTDALRELGIDPESVTDVVVTHLHYDHAGNLDHFPAARIWVQEAEVAYVTGAAMRHPELSHFFEVDDVCALLKESFRGRVNQVAGQVTLAEGLELHLVGGHTPGLQVVRVLTERGWVVLASDALHYYENFERRNPFPAIVDVVQMMDGYDRLLELAPGLEHIVPGHDPAVMEQYGAGSAGLPDGMVALHHRPAPEQVAAVED
ncbi:MBL fold metallo-hydrolase [Gordonia jinghuaiqii]|uniref:N-acyl homoserine lactonase family protein n=1 Tax=Gordonia jinghuaiqii TaxID=2758710 RepID=A0A7D7LXP3_9ACTN|nr:N-acyl homoserine lactonase family protein [Gordonia jinghuaiqii]MCR5978550.1 MBL fold metallo-hydrolase [Gordonia jinghuaiqii]QMT02875.1 N-acyl homoserine lactonase family protein [Gordonia jinghuaiqii]